MTIQTGDFATFTSTQVDPGPPGHPERSGQIVKVGLLLSAKEADLFETGPMWHIEFLDGLPAHAFADELTPADPADVAVALLAQASAALDTFYDFTVSTGRPRLALGDLRLWREIADREDLVGTPEDTMKALMTAGESVMNDDADGMQWYVEHLSDLLAKHNLTTDRD